jgi:transcriptional regulator with XRE-family HTH domain
VNARSLALVARAKGVRASGLARLAGVSRQAVSGWLRSGRGDVAVRDGHLIALARGLGVPPETLADPPEGLEGEADHRVDFLWDGLFPDVDSFALALAREEPHALARLVSRVGLFEGAAIAGPAAWRRFPEYERDLPPARRTELRNLWRLQTDLGLV